MMVAVAVATAHGFVSGDQRVELAGAVQIRDLVGRLRDTFWAFEGVAAPVQA